MKAFEQINGRVVLDEIIPARAGWSREIKAGQTLRIVDLEGKQAVDFLCYNARDYEDRYAAADTMKINGNPQRHGHLLGELQSALYRGRRHLRLSRHDWWMLFVGAQWAPLQQAG